MVLIPFFLIALEVFANKSHCHSEWSPESMDTYLEVLVYSKGKEEFGCKNHQRINKEDQR